MICFFRKLYGGTKNQFFEMIARDLKEEKRRFIVTANAETFMIGKKDTEFYSLLADENTLIIPDGISLVKSAKKLGFSVSERIPGVELAYHLLKTGNKEKKSACFLGAKKEVLDLFCKKVKKEFPDLTVLKAQDGYCENKDAFFEEIKKQKPDLVFVALGIPSQEKQIFRHLNDFEKGIFVGLGGSFDVLSGTKERAPRFFIDHNLEWLYRIAKEPKRIGRFLKHNLRFIFLIMKEKKKL